MPLTALIFLGLTGLAGTSLFFDSDIDIQSEHIVAKITEGLSGIHCFTVTLLNILFNDLLELMRNVVTTQG